MGLFSSKSKSKSTSTTTYTDNSRNLNVDLSSGDLSGGAKNNIIAGGNITYTGLTDDLTEKVFGVLQDTYGMAYDWVSDAIGTTNKQYTENLNVLKDSNKQTVEALQTAYNSEQATISSFKTYALYGLVAFVAWAYFGRRKK